MLFYNEFSCKRDNESISLKIQRNGNTITKFYTTHRFSKPIHYSQFGASFAWNFYSRCFHRKISNTPTHSSRSNRIFERKRRSSSPCFFFSFFSLVCCPIAFAANSIDIFFDALTGSILVTLPIVFLLSEAAVPRALPSPFVSLYFVTLFPVVEHQPVPREYTR